MKVVVDDGDSKQTQQHIIIERVPRALPRDDEDGVVISIFSATNA